jgi:signal transduction histidine kinase
MLKSLLIVILFFLVKEEVSFGQEQKAENTKNILIIFGLAPNQPAYGPLLKEISDRLYEEYGENFNIYMEYLNLQNYPDGNFPKEIFDSYNAKYREIKLDLLICVGINAVPTIKKFADQYLLDLPAISTDIDFSDYGYLSDLRLNDKTAVINMKLYPSKSIDVALKLFPETSSVYFISGMAPIDKILISITKDWAEKNLRNKELTYLSNLTMPEILHLVSKLPKKSIIFVLSFKIDRTLVEYTNLQVIRIISSEANSPVFGYSDLGLGDGAVGGYIASFSRVGQFMGDAAVKILNGTDPNLIQISEQDYYEYSFDWRQLKKWNVVNSKFIPNGSTILYEDINYIDKYKWIGGSVLLFLVLQFLLIANLVRLNRNQKLMTKKIILTENRYREFLHEDRSLRLNQLSASLSHELNQPLTAILSNAQAGINFINSNESTPELLKQILQKIVENDKRTASILSSIRGMLKLENREKEKVNINFIIAEVADVYKSESKKLNIELRTDLSEKPVYIFADSVQIQQVLLNFIFNSAQSILRSKSENRTILVKQLVKNEIVTVSVIDTGEGIKESIMDNLFRPFDSHKTDGMGIGLSICRAIIEDHNGKIWAENVPDGGAKFSFDLKILKDE